MELKFDLIRAGYADEIDWQASVGSTTPTNSDFLREAAWVILSAGLREQVVRIVFARLSKVFRNWTSVDWVVSNKVSVRRKAERIFAHRGKLNAIISIAETLADGGLGELWASTRASGPEALQHLPFMGPATSRHLAKNLGISLSKPDRHLVRIARHLGFENTDSLCDVVAAATGEKKAVVDLVLWRAANLGGEPAARLSTPGRFWVGAAGTTRMRGSDSEKM